MDVICKIRKRVIENTTVIVSRKLHGQGKILVKAGGGVSPEIVVAIAQTPAGFRSLNLASELGVSKKKAPQFLAKGVDQQVYEGELIAQNSNLFGIVKRQILSPVDGLIKGYNQETGVLTIEFQTKSEKVVSGVWGEVVSVENNNIEIRSNVTQIYGIVGSGRVRQGVIYAGVKPEDFLLPQSLNPNMADRIIVGGAFVSHQTISKALTFRISGIVSGGMHTRDYLSAGGKAQGQATSDIGTTFVILEGFGNIPINADTYDVLKRNDGRFALIDGDQACITIPNKAEPDRKILSSKIASRQLQIGDQVRITGGVRIGITGKVISIVDELGEANLRQTLAEVEATQKKYKVPAKNLEIIE